MGFDGGVLFLGLCCCCCLKIGQSRNGRSGFPFGNESKSLNFFWIAYGVESEDEKYGDILEFDISLSFFHPFAFSVA